MKLIKQHLLATKTAVENVIYKSTTSTHDRIARFGSTGAVGMPTGTSAQQPSSPFEGMFRYNIDNDKFEYYANGSWKVVRAEGKATITKDIYTGDGSTTNFGPMTFSVSDENTILVYIQNVWQEGGINYTVSGTTINFTSSPPNGHKIVVLHGFDTV
jgi:hypothetical protein